MKRGKNRKELDIHDKTLLSSTQIAWEILSWQMERILKNQADLKEVVEIYFLSCSECSSSEQFCSLYTSQQTCTHIIQGTGIFSTE
jgi:hypothetical protein